MFERLLVELEKYVPQGTHVVEFYAGGGAIGLTLVDKCATIYFNEIVELAEKCFEESCKKLSIQQTNKLKYECGPAEKQTAILDGDAGVVILDPPRKGIDETLMNKLCSSTTTKRLIYVSCGWSSFKKDCQKLLENQWKIVSAEAFLFFPGSDHLEILAVFDK
jgi:tRNA/tmRNA/rRNA uracil-C5-methylase (TrmA/RlmC/RlmD family)